MSKPVVPVKDDNEKPAEVAAQVQEFLSTPLGQRYLTTLSIKYNELHQAAEADDTSTEKQAHCIQQAKGLKFAISWLTDREALQKAEFYKKK